MHVTEQAEEILEAIWIARETKNIECPKLSDLREMPNNEILKELIDSGIIAKCGSEGIKLSENGWHEARDAVRRHRLAERLMTDILQIKKEMIHETACQFEHHLHKGIDRNVCTLLGHPKTCPHGSPIPSGACCEEQSRSVTQAITKLSDLKPGEGGHVAYLNTSEPKRSQMLISMGVVPGTDIKLLAGFPSYLFQLGQSQFAVDSEVAREIYIRR